MNNTVILHTNNLTCANCAMKIENDIKNLPNVQDAKINLLNQTATIISSDKDIVAIVNRIVKKYESDVEFTESVNKDSRIEFPKFLLFILGIFIVSLVLDRMISGQKYELFFHLFYLAIYFVTGKGVIKSFFNNLKSGNFLDENFLMFIATAGAIFIGAYEEAAGVMLFYSIGEAFESIAVKKSNNAILNLEKFKPKIAHKIVDNNVIEIIPENIKQGDLILVKTGEINPIDGKIIEGSAEFDLSSITGESNSVYVNEGENIPSGAIALTSSVKIEAAFDYENSTVNKIEKIIIEANEKKSETEKFITKFAKTYTPIVVILSILTFAVPSLFKLGGIDFFDKNYTDYLYNALIFLVISCPCALVLSVPLTFFAAIGKAAQDGILIKGSAYLEVIRQTKTFVFDKTGTLTYGNFKIVDVILSYDSEYSKEDILKYAAAIESHSTHPVSNAFSNISFEGLVVEEVKDVPGCGIEGKIKNKIVKIGNDKFVKGSFDYNNSGLKLFVSIDNKVAGLIVIRDEIKKDAKETIEFLHSKNFKTVILSGDTESNVKFVANELGVKNYYYSLKPDEKIEMLKKFMSHESKVVALGDGINDAPLLTVADVGIAMGTKGSALSVETSNVVFLGDDLNKLKKLIKISNKSHRIVLENIIFILAVKSVFMILGALGYATLWEAVIADVGVAIISILNSMKIFRK